MRFSCAVTKELLQTLVTNSCFHQLDIQYSSVENAIHLLIFFQSCYQSPAPVEIFVHSHPAPAGICEILTAPTLHCFRPKFAPVTLYLKTTKSHSTCFIASGNLFSGSFQSQRKVLKINCEVKMWNLVKLQPFFLRAVWKKSMSFTEELI